MKIGIIGAMDVEVETLRSRMEGATLETVSGMQFAQGRLAGCDAVVAVAGVGKVSAAMCAQTLILRYQPDAVINTGVAGGIGPDLKVLDVVLATAVVQHDMDTSPIGDPVGYVSKIGLVEIPCDPGLREKLLAAAANVPGLRVHTGVIATGDQFICDEQTRQRIHHRFQAKAVEMEGAAVAHACYMHGVPCGVIRSISDQANGASTMDYPSFVRLAAANSEQVVEHLLREEEAHG